MTFRKQIQTILPAPVDLAQKSLRTAIHRLGLWGGLFRDCRGVSPVDQVVLVRSFRASLAGLTDAPGQWREPQLVEHATLVVTDGFRFTIRARSDDLGHIRQRTHQRLIDPLLGHLPPGGTAIDAGANIGIFTANFSRAVGPTGRVIAVEMMPETAISLRQTIALNDLGNVELVEMALSDEAGKVLDIGMPDASHFGQASIIRNLDGRGRSISVMATTLDDVTKGLERIHIMKMDLEGAELLALRGARRTLQITDAILYEVAEDDAEIDRIFSNNGYRIRRIDGLNKLAERVRR